MPLQELVTRLQSLARDLDNSHKEADDEAPDWRYDCAVADGFNEGQREAAKQLRAVLSMLDERCAVCNLKRNNHRQRHRFVKQRLLTESLG